MRFWHRCGKRRETYTGDQRAGWREWDIKRRSVEFCEFALKRALRVANDKMILVQMDPEQIFEAVMDGSEAEFRAAMLNSNVSCPGRVLFIER